MSDASLCIQRSLEANPLREPLLRSVIDSLGLPAGSHGLDAGCGIGLQASLLAEATGPDGRVTGMDLLPELLAFASERSSKAGFGDRLRFCAGDVASLPFEDASFDWAWSADCIGYPLSDLKRPLSELTRVLKPGGSLVLLGWTSQQLLPGYPLLEARLNASCSAYIPYFQDKDPELHFLRAAQALRRAGLEEVQAQTHVGDVQAPLRPDERGALVSLFEMLWGEERPERASPEDWEDYRRLCDPASPDFILDLPDYYGFFTYTLFHGRLPRLPQHP
jgi:ubiquinone/menaquinone biosynthesis C-methylase UbiE